MSKDFIFITALTDMLNIISKSSGKQKEKEQKRNEEVDERKGAQGLTVWPLGSS